MNVWSLKNNYCNYVDYKVDIDPTLFYIPYSRQVLKLYLFGQDLQTSWQTWKRIWIFDWTIHLVLALFSSMFYNILKKKKYNRLALRFNCKNPFIVMLLRWWVITPLILMSMMIPWRRATTLSPVMTHILFLASRMGRSYRVIWLA